MNEESLLGGYLESTIEPHAIARIAGIKMREACNRQYGTRFMAVMPTNFYGPNDNFGLETSHMLAANTRNDEAETRFIMSPLEKEHPPERAFRAHQRKRCGF